MQSSFQEDVSVFSSVHNSECEEITCIRHTARKAHGKCSGLQHTMRHRADAQCIVGHCIASIASMCMSDCVTAAKESTRRRCKLAIGATCADVDVTVADHCKFTYVQTLLPTRFTPRQNRKNVLRWSTCWQGVRNTCNNNCGAN